MLQFYAERFIGATNVIAGTYVILKGIKINDTTNLKTMTSIINELHDDLEALDMPASLNAIKGLKRELETPRPRLQAIQDLFTVLYTNIPAELKAKQFFYVPLSKVSYYDKPWFGDKVEDRFLDAVDDMREAGNCFALNRWAGVIYHCMGIVDVGMKELAKHLRCTIDVYLDDWNTIITKIEGKVLVKRRAGTAQEAPRALKSRWKKIEPFYEEVIGDIRGLKNAWRNPFAHFRMNQQINEPKAKKALETVRDFMQTLTDNLPKRRQKKQP